MVAHAYNPKGGKMETGLLAKWSRLSSELQNNERSCLQKKTKGGQEG